MKERLYFAFRGALALATGYVVVRLFVQWNHTNGSTELSSALLWAWVAWAIILANDLGAIAVRALGDPGDE